MNSHLCESNVDVVKAILIRWDMIIIVLSIGQNNEFP